MFIFTYVPSKRLKYSSDFDEYGVNRFIIMTKVTLGYSLINFNNTRSLFSPHLEKCFVKSTNICLAQQKFPFKNESMEILSKLVKKILLVLFAIPTKNFCIISKNKDLQIKITKLLY